MNLEVQFRIHKGSAIIPILSQINPIPRIDTYLLLLFFVYIFLMFLHISVRAPV